MVEWFLLVHLTLAITRVPKFGVVKTIIVITNLGTHVMASKDERQWYCLKKT